MSGSSGSNTQSIFFKTTDAISNQVGAQIDFIGGGTNFGTLHGDIAFKTATDNGAVGVPVTERMRITNSGNVGIGTTSPGAKLDVTNGNIQISTAQNKLVFDSPTRYIQGTRSSADYLTFSQNGYAPGLQMGFDAGTGFGPTMTMTPVV